MLEKFFQDYRWKSFDESMPLSKLRTQQSKEVMLPERPYIMSKSHKDWVDYPCTWILEWLLGTKLNRSDLQVSEKVESNGIQQTLRRIFRVSRVVWIGTVATI